MSVCLGENIENSGLARASSLTEYIFIQQVSMGHPVNARTVLVVWDAQRTADGHVSPLEASCQSSKGDSWAQILPATTCPPAPGATTSSTIHSPHGLSMMVSAVVLPRSLKTGFERALAGNCWFKDLSEWHGLPNDCFLLFWACWWCHTMFVIDLLHEHLAERKRALVDLCQENERRANYLSVRIGSHTFH